MIVETTTTAGTKICPKCLQHYPATYFHCCPSAPPGPPAYIVRGFSEDEIRRIVREEIASASALRRTGNEP